ncbi:MAG: hypothetical protein LM561_03500, partial [Desulfurococcaceae archaeon]|nr:hypothetical protein [Desulfurococcaceae archaeon]
WLVEDLLKSTEGLESVMADVLRVLYVCMGSLWLSELMSEYRVFVEALGGTPASEDDVRKAIDRLSEMGLVSVREGIRATMSQEGEKTYLISLKLSSQQLSLLRNDLKISKYRDLWRYYLKTT